MEYLYVFATRARELRNLVRQILDSPAREAIVYQRQSLSPSPCDIQGILKRSKRMRFANAVG